MAKEYTFGGLPVSKTYGQTQTGGFVGKYATKDSILEVIIDVNHPLNKDQLFPVNCKVIKLDKTGLVLPDGVLDGLTTLSVGGVDLLSVPAGGTKIEEDNTGLIDIETPVGVTGEVILTVVKIAGKLA